MIEEGLFGAYRSWSIERNGTIVESRFRKGLARNVMQKDLGDRLIETVTLVNVPLSARYIDTLDRKSESIIGTSQIVDAPDPIVPSCDSKCKCKAKKGVKRGSKTNRAK